MTEKEKVVFASLVTLLEEHICANSGFSNLGEAVIFRAALAIIGRKTLPRIEALMNEYLKDYDEIYPAPNAVSTQRHTTEIHI